METQTRNFNSFDRGWWAPSICHITVCQWAGQQIHSIFVSMCSSYTTFQYSNLAVTPATISAGQNVSVKVSVMNTGSMSGDEVREGSRF